MARWTPSPDLLQLSLHIPSTISTLTAGVLTALAILFTVAGNYNFVSQVVRATGQDGLNAVLRTFDNVRRDVYVLLTILTVALLRPLLAPLVKKIPTTWYGPRLHVDLLGAIDLFAVLTAISILFDIVRVLFKMHAIESYFREDSHPGTEP